VVQRVDLNAIMDRVDVNKLVDQVDVDKILDQVDVDKILDQVDVDKLVDRVDLNKILDQVDVDRLLAKVDLDETAGPVDVDAVVDRVDINGIAQGVDIDAIAMHTDIGAMIARSSGGIAGDARDATRSQAVGLDEWIARWVARLLRRDAPAQRPHFGGAVSRFVGLRGGPGGQHRSIHAGPRGHLLRRQHHQPGTPSPGTATISRSRSCSSSGSSSIFAYSWGASGKTLGMALLGVKVVAADGTQAGPRRAVLRTLAFPLSFLLLGLGFTGILFQRDRRALPRHDRRDGGGVLLGSPRGPAPVSWTGRPPTRRPRTRRPQTRTPPLSWHDPVRRGGFSPTPG